MSQKNIIIGITGASGVVYAVRLLDVLARLDRYKIHLVISKAGAQAIWEELRIRVDLSDFHIEPLIGRRSGQIIYYQQSDIAASIASGSFSIEGMVVIPCSMGTLASIATGTSQNLIHRAADVCIKESRKLILVPRETPLSAIHLENMLKLARLGVCILPAIPGFYHFPNSVEDLVDFIVSKTLDQFGIDAGLIKRWD